MTRSYLAYQNTFIYKITCKDENIKNTYVGLTMNFDERLKSHKRNCKNFKRQEKLYNFIRCNGGWDNWEMSILEKCVFKTRTETGKRERYWYEKLNADLNINCPSRNNEELYELKKCNVNKKLE
jgi:predicted GIY-YIG superfamily endonuclease